MRPLCIYHGNCADGFGAAWVVWKYFKGEVDFHAGVYQNDPPDVRDRVVLLVDFSYKRKVMLEIAELAQGVLVLDHHKSAMEDLAPDGRFIFRAVEPELCRWENYIDTIRENIAIYGPANEVYTIFDLNRSGAGLTWDFFNPGVPRPKLLDHIEDRDLWRFKLPNTREIQAALFSHPYDFALWNELMAMDARAMSIFESEGRAIERKHHKDIAELTKVVTRPMQFRLPSLADYPNEYRYAVVPMANLPYTLTSDAGHLLCGDEYPFAGCYWDTPEGRVFSLRSREDGADVGEIAKLYGGGGHKHAAGFRVPFSDLAKFDPV